MKPHVPLLLLYGLLAGELATAVPVKGTVGPGRHAVVDDSMFVQPVNWPLPAQGPPRHSNMTATTLLTAPYKKKKRAVETAYNTYFNRLFPYWKTDVEVIPIMQPNQIQPNEMQLNEMQPVDEKPAEEQPAEKQSVEKQSAEKQSTEKKPTDKKPAENKPADKKPTNKKPADKKPAGKKPDAKKANNNASAATTKKPSAGSQRVTKNGPFKVVSANINNPANKQADSSSAAAATTTKKNDDSTCTDSSTFKKTEDDNDNNGGSNNNNINNGSTVYESNIANSTVDDSVINNSTVVDSRVLDSTVSDTTLLHSTVVDDVVIDDSTLEDTTVAGQSAVTEGSTLSGSDVLGGSAVAGGSTVIDSNILDGARVVDGSTVVGESRVGDGSAVAGGSNVFDGSVVTRRDRLAKREMPWMPDSAKIVLCIFSPFVGCPMAIASELDYPGERQKRSQLVDGSGSGSAAALAKRVKSDSELAGMVFVCTFVPFLCPIYGDGREKRQLADGGSSSSSSSIGKEKRELVDDGSSSVVTVAKRGEKPLSMGAKVVVCTFIIFLCPWAVLSNGQDAAGIGPEKRELVDGGDSFGAISAIDTPMVPIAKRLSKPARTTVCVLFPFICPLVWRRGLDPASQISSSDNTALDKRSAEPEAKDGALRQCGAPLPWWCTNVTKRTTHLLPAATESGSSSSSSSSSLLDKRRWTPTKFILCRILFVFCFTDLGTRDLSSHAHAPSTDDDDNTTVVAKKRSPQDGWAATQYTGLIDSMMKNEIDPLPPVMFVPSGDPPPEDEVDKKRRTRRMRRSSVALDLTVDGNTVAHVAAETEGKKSPLQIAADYIMRVVTGQVPPDPIVESKKEDGDDAKKMKREEESSRSPGSPPAPPVEGSEVAVEGSGSGGGGNTDAAVAKREFSWGKAISIITGLTVITDHLEEPIEAVLNTINNLFGRKRSVPPPSPQPVGAEDESMMTTKRDDHEDFFMPPHFPGLPLSPKN